MNHKEIDLSHLVRHPLYLHSHKTNLKKEILKWRNRIGDNTPLATVLSHTDLEDKISLVLVPLLASSGLNILKPIWSDELTEDQYLFPLTRKHIRIPSHREGYIQQIALDRLFELKQRMCSEHGGSGLSLLKMIGDSTQPNDTLAKVFLPSSWEAELIEAEVRNFYSISDSPPEFQPLIEEKIKGSFRF